MLQQSDGLEGGLGKLQLYDKETYTECLPRRSHHTLVGMTVNNYNAKR